MVTFLVIISILEAVVIAALALWGVFLWKQLIAYRNDEYDNIPLDPINFDYYPDSILDGGNKK